MAMLEASGWTRAPSKGGYACIRVAVGARQPLTTAPPVAYFPILPNRQLITDLLVYLLQPLCDDRLVCAAELQLRTVLQARAVPCVLLELAPLLVHPVLLAVAQRSLPCMRPDAHGYC